MIVNDKQKKNNTPQVRIAHRYVLQGNFVGRLGELKMLTKWIDQSRRAICIVEAIGGCGKSALTWVWIHQAVLGRQLDVHSKTPAIKLRPQSVLWRSFYEQNASFREFLLYLQNTLSIPLDEDVADSSLNLVDACVEVLN